MTAKLTVVPLPAPVGSVVTITGTGFANTKTRLSLDGVGETTNIFRPAPDGTFRVGITVSTKVKKQTLLAEQNVGGKWTVAATLSPLLTFVGGGPGGGPGPDTTPPVITGQNAVPLTTTSIVVTWTTNEASTSQVDYGTTTGYALGPTTINNALVTTHNITIASLSADTLYHVRPRSKDAAGNEVVGTDMTVTTLAAAGTPGGGQDYKARVLARSGLRWYVPLDETGGGTVADAKVGDTGTFPAGLTLDDAADLPVNMAPHAPRFTAASSQYVTFASHASRNLGNTFTLVVWAKTNGVDYHTFISKGLHAYEVGTADTQVPYLADGDTAIIARGGTSLVNDGLWHHVVYVKSGSTRHIYVDGNLDDSGSDADATLGDTATALELGRWDGGANYVDGWLVHLQGYDVAWGQAEVDADLADSVAASTGVDTTPPVISAIAVALSADSSAATISWTLDEFGQGEIRYGTTAALGQVSVRELSFNYKDHIQTISSLPANSTIYFAIWARDVSGNESLSGTQTFSTGGVIIVPPPDIPPPAPGFTTIQAAVNATSAGGAFSIPAGTYHEQVTINKRLTVYAYGAVVIDGQNARQFAFEITADDVTIEGVSAGGLEIKNHRPPYQRGALNSHDCSRTTVRHVYSHDNPGAGLGQDLGGHNTIGGGMSFTGGTGHLVEDCQVSANQTCGIHANGSGATAFVIRRTLISNNNSGSYNLGWHSGGIKGTLMGSFLIEDCTVTGNTGDGIWGDINMTGGIIRRNLIHHNSFSGIHWEISNDCQMSDNVVYECGWGRMDGWAYGAGIQIVASRLITVTNNIVAWLNRGISVIAQARGGFPSSSPDNYSNIAFSGNLVVNNAGTWLSNWVDDRGGGPLFTAAGNNGSGGKYWANTGEPQTDRFDWAGSRSTLAAYNATPGEEGGVYLSTTDRDVILNAKGVPTTGEH